MGLFFNKNKELNMDIPPPPPADGDDIVESTPQRELRRVSFQKKLPSLDQGMPRDMPSFPEIPEDTDQDELPDHPEEMKKEISQVQEEVFKVRKGPKFISSGSFQEILSEAESAKKSLKEIDAKIDLINSIKESEEKEFDKWRIQMEHVEQKISQIDRIIFKGE